MSESNDLPGPNELPGPWDWGLGETGSPSNDPMDGYGLLPFYNENDENLRGTVEWDTGWDSIVVEVRRVTEYSEKGDPVKYGQVHRSEHDTPSDVAVFLPYILGMIDARPIA